MKKFYSVLATVALSFVSMTAIAQEGDTPEYTPTISNENSILQNEDYHMRLFKSYDFLKGRLNGKEMSVTGDGCFKLKTDKADFQLNGFDAFQVEEPKEMSNFYVQIGTAAVNLRTGKDGIHNYGSGARWIVMGGVKEGQIIVIKHSEGKNDGKGNATTVKPNVLQNNNASGWADVPTDPIQVEDITEAVHGLQDLVDADANGEADNVHDGYHYWKVLTNCDLYIDIERNNYIEAIQMWMDANAEESVSVPTYKLKKVDDDKRIIELFPGESTLGMNCSVTYGIMEGEGNSNEDLEYVDGEPITLNAAQDEDEDGVITIECVTVSESGAKSEPATYKISVGAVQLNEPTLTLVGLNGEERAYQIGWTNNTICEEDYHFVISADDEASYRETEAKVGIGEIVTAKKNIKVTVKVDGYIDGVNEMAEVDLCGVSVRRKAAVTSREETTTDGEGNQTTTTVEVHDWDFVNLSKAQQAIIRGEVVESCYIIVENGEQRDSLVFSAKEFEDGVSADGKTDLSSATPNYAPSCWTWDGGNKRATLNVVSAADGYEGTIYNANDNGYGYVEDKAQVFKGIEVNCAPNTKNASTILQYINGTLGTYFMSRPILTFPRESVAAGELVLIYRGQGGSNWTGWTSAIVYTAPTTEPLAVTLESGGVHVFYIDVYTYDNLPADEFDPTAISSVASTSATPVAIYSIAGAKVAKAQKGINIVKMSDGSVKKVLVK